MKRLIKLINDDVAFKNDYLFVVKQITRKNNSFKRC